MDPESGEPHGNCVFARLSQSGHTSSSLASADARDVPSLEYLYRLVYPEQDQHVINKMQPDCLKLAPIIQKCKFGIFANFAHNVINREDKNGPPPPSGRGVAALKESPSPPRYPRFIPYRVPWRSGEWDLHPHRALVRHLPLAEQEGWKTDYSRRWYPSQRWGLATPRNLILSLSPLRKQGQGEGGSSGHGIQIQ